MHKSGFRKPLDRSQKMLVVQMTWLDGSGWICIISSFKYYHIQLDVEPCLYSLLECVYTGEYWVGLSCMFCILENKNESSVNLVTVS